MGPSPPVRPVEVPSKLNTVVRMGWRIQWVCRVSGDRLNGASPVSGRTGAKPTRVRPRRSCPRYPQGFLNLFFTFRLGGGGHSLE